MSTLLSLLLLVTFAVGAGGARVSAIAGNASHTNEILVRFKTGASQQAIDALNASMATQQVDAIPALGVRVLRVPRAQDSARIADRYAHNPLVEFAEPNAPMTVFDTRPNDPQFSLNQWNLFKVSAPAAWDTTTGSGSVVIAVLDGGVWSGHPDLIGKVTAGYNFISGNTDTSDADGHGTWVASVAAAQTNNGTGMAGVSWASPIMPVKVCNDTSCSTSNVAKGMIWAADNGAKVINLSLGGYTSCSSTYQSAVDYAWSRGLVVVAAAGNSGSSTIASPASCDNVVAVGATDRDDGRTSFSSYGASLDLVAPGTNVVCAVLTGGYGACQGTSFSAPHVAGAAALLLSVGASNSAAVSALTAGADDVGDPGWDQYYGWGRLNIYRALLALGGAPSSPTATRSPTPTTSSTPASPTPTFTPTASPTPFGSDTVSPSVTLSNPGQGQTVKRSVSIAATVSLGVVRVEFYIDGVLYKTLSSAPYSTSWNTRRWANGSHTVTSKAFDAVGNSASDAHTVTVSN